MTSRGDTPLLIHLATFASSACIADSLTHPFDVAKVRLQVQGETARIVDGKKIVYRGLFGTLVTLARTEGFRSIYNGLAAGLQRQLCFSTIRLGCYEPVKQFYTGLFNSSELGALNVTLRILAGLTTGFLCVCCAQPTDVVKIRFQAMTKGQGGDRYKSTRDAYKKIYRTEGLRGLWRGTIPNAVRNAIVNVAEVVVYDSVKEFILTRKLMNDTIYCHFTTAVIAGLCATFVASPVDVVKTRYMNSPKGTYRGALHCAFQTFKKEGIFAFYKGFFPSFCRIAGWNIFMWITYEQLRRLERNVRKSRQQ